jgi:hypothetical protein
MKQRRRLAGLKQATSLDDARSWVIVSEHIIDEWPNAGLSPVPGKPSVFGYGFIPRSLFAQIKARNGERITPTQQGIAGVAARLSTFADEHIEKLAKNLHRDNGSLLRQSSNEGQSGVTPLGA